MCCANSRRFGWSIALGWWLTVSVSLGHAANLCIDAGGSQETWHALGYDGEQCDLHFSSINTAADAAAASGDTLILSHTDDTIHQLTTSTPYGITFSIRNAKGEADYTTCIIDASHGQIRENFKEGGTVTISGVTIQNGLVPPAVDVTGTATNDSELVIDHVRFLNNFSEEISHSKPAALALRTQRGGYKVMYRIEDSAFEDNTHVGGSGAAIFVNHGSALTIERTLFQRNVIADDINGRGAAIFAPGWGDFYGTASITINSSEFYANSAPGNGALINTSGIDVTFNDTIVGAQGAGNYSSRTQKGTTGVIYVWTDDVDVHLTVRDSEFAYNYTNVKENSGDGGAFRVADYGNGRVTALFEDSLFHHNEAYNGAAIHVGRQSKSTVRRCRFWGNRAYGRAGAYFASGTVASLPFAEHTLEYSIFNDNWAGDKGGAVFVSPYATANIRNCTFTDNVADNEANHIFSRDNRTGVPSVIVNSLFWSNAYNDNELHGVLFNTGVTPGEIVNCAYTDGDVSESGVNIQESILLHDVPVLADQRPRSSSQVIDAGIFLDDITQAVDVAGHLVPQGEAPDVGALEWWKNPYFPRAAVAADHCRGDIYQDGAVDGSDLALLSAELGRMDCQDERPCASDIDQDGDVDGSDLALFSGDFGRANCPLF